MLEGGEGRSLMVQEGWFMRGKGSWRSSERPRVDEWKEGKGQVIRKDSGCNKKVASIVENKKKQETRDRKRRATKVIVQTVAKSSESGSGKRGGCQIFQNFSEKSPETLKPETRAVP